MEIIILPLGITQDVADSNILAVEKMISTNQSYYDREKQRFNSLTYEEKRAEKESPALRNRINPCPICRCLPCCWTSFAEGYGIDGVFNFNFDPDQDATVKALIDRCPEHGPITRRQDGQRFWSSRFKTKEEMVAAWNSSLPMK